MKFSAPQNVPHMFATEFVFQLEMLALNEAVLMVLLLETDEDAKRYLRDSTPLTSHALMGAMVLSVGSLTLTPVGALPQFTPEGSFEMH